MLTVHAMAGYLSRRRAYRSNCVGTLPAEALLITSATASGDTKKGGSFFKNSLKRVTPTAPFATAGLFCCSITHTLTTQPQQGEKLRPCATTVSSTFFFENDHVSIFTTSFNVLTDCCVWRGGVEGWSLYISILRMTDAWLGYHYTRQKYVLSKTKQHATCKHVAGAQSPRSINLSKKKHVVLINIWRLSEPGRVVGRYDTVRAQPR